MSPNRIGPIVRIAELEIDPNQIDAYDTLLSEEIEAAVRIEPGVLFLYTLPIKGSLEKVRVIEAAPTGLLVESSRCSEGII